MSKGHAGVKMSGGVWEIGRLDKSGGFVELEACRAAEVETVDEIVVDDVAGGATDAGGCRAAVEALGDVDHACIKGPIEGGLHGCRALVATPCHR